MSTICSMSEFSDSSSDSSYNSHGDAASESSTVYTPGNSEANYGAFNDLELGSMDLLRQETRVIKDCLNWTIRFLLSLILFFVLAAVLMWARIELDSRALAGVWIFVIVVWAVLQLVICSAGQRRQRNWVVYRIGAPEMARHIR